MEPLFFADAAGLRAWFEQNHDTAPELILGYWKKHTGVPTVTHPQAIEQALCFGWIDSIGRRIDDERHQCRFTPRRKASVWSAINVAAVARLTEAGLMRPAGLAAFEQRKPDRVAAYAHEHPDDAGLEPDQEARLKAEAGAWAWFSAQSPAYRKAAIHWVVSAKRPETREKRLVQLIADAAAGRRVPPLARR
jgi:uncharacterized protein YdeI (YjbR/CyaY-like superfamily)